ncbi:MAG: hypothetical protein IJ357_00895 [Oscillospiraceae bacterium]|nr:hypothetical protein [Oscillospiraceae bacterium]
MNTMDRLKDLIDRVFEGEIDTSALSPASRLKEEVGMSSIGMLYMAMALEEEFGLSLTNDDFAKLLTVSDVIARIEG